MELCPGSGAWSTPNASRAGFFSRFMSMAAACSRVTVSSVGSNPRRELCSSHELTMANRLRLPSMASARSAGASASEESQLKKYAPE